MKKITLCSALLPLVFMPTAQAETAFGNGSLGTVSGDINLFYKSLDNNSAADSAYATAFLGLKYQTPEYEGLAAGIAVRHGSELYEKHTNDADEGTNTLVSEAYIHYSRNDFSISLGRQEIDLEWLGDFHEALTFNTMASANTELTLGYSRAIAVAAEDDLQDSFTDIGDEGVYFLDAKVQPTEFMSLNPYVLYSADIATSAGLKADLEYSSGIGITLHYALSNTDIDGETDGDVLHLDVRGNVADVGMNAGYIKTDKVAGIGHLGDLGDNINPFEEGNQVYEADAKTIYVGAAYGLGNLSLSALYGQTDDSGNAKEKELDLVAEYDFADQVENLSLAAVFADISADSSADDYQKLTLMLSYGF